MLESIPGTCGPIPATAWHGRKRVNSTRRSPISPRRSQSIQNTPLVSAKGALTSAGSSYLRTPPILAFWRIFAVLVSHVLSILRVRLLGGSTLNDQPATVTQSPQMTSITREVTGGSDPSSNDPFSVLPFAETLRSLGAKLRICVRMSTPHP